MPFDVELKVGDIVRSFNECRGTVTHLNYFKGELASVTVKWLNGRLMTHPCTAEDIWLEGHPAKEDPEVKARKRFVAHQDEFSAENLALQEAYRLSTREAVEKWTNIVWTPEPLNKNSTLEELAQTVGDWSEIVKTLDGNVEQELIKHDLFTREYLHGVLNGLKIQAVAIPAELLDILAQADQYFIDHSIALPPPNVVWLNNFLLHKPMMVQDIDVFWYEYRWPRAKE